MRLFARLERPELAAEMVAAPECLLGPWAMGLKRHHPTFEGDLFRHKLLLCALLASKDISAVESRHESIRRALTTRSVQTHTMSFHE